MAVAIRWAFFLSIAGMLGTSAFRLGVLGPLSGDPLLGQETSAAALRTRDVAWGVAALALVALPARLLSQSAQLFGERALDASSLGRLLSSQWGGAWLLELAMLGVFVGGVLLVRGAEDRRRGWWAMLLAGVGTALVPSLAGHASATAPEIRRFAVLNDAVHVTAASVWMGTLAMVLVVGLGFLGRAAAPVGSPAGGAWDGEEGASEEEPSGSAAGQPPAAALLPPLARMVNAFSRLAMTAVAALVLTGVVNAWLHLGSPGALFATPYGRTLLVKLALAGVVVALGFYNWRVVRPALAEAPRPGLLRIPATVEVAVGLAVLAVTAALVATPPPAP